jgi:hypothetical protein
MIKDTMSITNRKNIIVIIFLALTILISMSMVSATGELETIPTLEPVTQGHSVELPQGGTNGTAAWSYCNISTIVDPDHNTIVHDVVRTATGTSFIYVLPGSNTSKLGTYTVTGYCGDGINKISFNYKFPVTTTGRDNSISLWIMMVLLAFGIILFIIAFAVDNIYIAFLSSVIWVVAGILIYVYGFGNLSDMYTRAISMVTLAIGLIIFFASSFHHDDGEGIAKAFGLDKKEDKDEYDYFASKD